MTRTTNARVAGAMFLLYIGIGVSSMVLFGQASSGGDTAARLASIAQHAQLVRVTIVLSLLTFGVAIALAVALYSLTRDVDRDLALLALCCRGAEAIMAPVATAGTLALLAVATGGSPAGSETPLALGALLLKLGVWSGTIAATCFAMGSTLFCYLFLRGAVIPVPLAWLGLVASLLLVLLLPGQVAGFLTGPVTTFMWLPMLLFEVPLGLWLLIKGASVPRLARA